MDAECAIDALIARFNSRLDARTSIEVRGLRPNDRINPWDPRYISVDGVEPAVTVTIPTEDLRRLMMSTSASMHPAFEDLLSQQERMRLYDSDPQFKEMVDGVNTYLRLRSD